jgi:hypothetical protein
MSTPPTPAKRVQRTQQELVEALDRHLRLLAAYAVRAFEEGDPDYCGEVATKLRLLVAEPKRKNSGHRPLLLGLMDAAGADIRVQVRAVKVPGSPAVSLTLREYLAGEVEARTPGGQEFRRSYIDLICMWADQHGAAHEDWAFQEEFVYARYSGICIREGERVEPAMVNTLRQVTENVLRVAEQFRPGFRRTLQPWRSS